MVKTEYCSVELDETNLKAFTYAIKNHYWYQMYVGRVTMYIVWYVIFIYSLMYLCDAKTTYQCGVSASATRTLTRVELLSLSLS